MAGEWLARLAKPGRRLAPMPAGRSGWGVYAGEDRRRRPFATVGAGEVRRAESAGLIVADGKGGYVAEAAGAAWVKRDRAGEDGFAAQHRETAPRAVIGADGAISEAMANLKASPLAVYARPRNGRAALLSPDEAAAGERLRADYDRAGMGVAVSDPSRAPRGKTPAGPRDPAGAPDGALDARARVMDALEAAGPGLDRLLVNVCLREVGMGAAERADGWPDRAGAHALKLALGRLAVHYGLRAPQRPADPFR